MTYFTDLMTWTPTQITQQVALVRGDLQLVCYFEQIAAAALNCERVGDVLTAAELEDMWAATFSEPDRKMIWSDK